MKKITVRKLAQDYEKIKSNFNKHSSLQITDNCEIVAEGCRRVVTSDENIVVLEQARNRVTVTGAGLKLRNWGGDGVVISGVIRSVELEESDND
jgi:hypothetical protein